MAWVGVLTVLAVTGAVYQAIGVARQRRRFAAPGIFIDVGGHRLHAICRGEGDPTVLLEAGIAASSLSWALVQQRIAAFTHVCAYDRAGLAWSDTPSCPRTFDRIVEELAIVAARIAVDRPVVLVGHSFGSFVVLAYAGRHPGRVAGLVLVDPPMEWLSITPQRAHLLWGAQRLSKIGAVLARLGVVRLSLSLLSGGRPGPPRQLARMFGPAAARTLERLVGEVRKLPPEVHPIVQAHWCQPKCFHAMADHLRALERDTARIAACVPPRDIPLVVISSGGQPADQLERHRRLAECAVGGRHIVAASSGHWVQFDEPQVIVEAVREMVYRGRGGSLEARSGK